MTPSERTFLQLKKPSLERMKEILGKDSHIDNMEKLLVEHGWTFYEYWNLTYRKTFK